MWWKRRRAAGKAAGKSLTHERRLLRTIIDSSPDQIYFKNDKHQFIVLNEATAKNLGTTVEKAIGKTDFDFFPEEKARKYCEDEKALMESGKPLIGKVEKTGSAGVTRWNYTTKVPVCDEAGKVVGIVGINRDITERKWMEEERVREVAAVAVEKARAQEAEKYVKIVEKLKQKLKAERRRGSTPLREKKKK